MITCEPADPGIEPDRLNVDRLLANKGWMPSVLSGVPGRFVV